MSKEVLKLALEALEYHTAQTRPIEQTNEAITAIKEALAQPEQEPVALKLGECWPENVMQMWDYYRKEIANGNTGSEPRDWFESLSEMRLVDTIPPQRTWIGLTEEEVEACFYHVDEAGIGLFDFAEAIEAKLKAKNERLEKNT